MSCHTADLPNTTVPRPVKPHTRPAPHSIIQTFCHNASPWPATYQTCPTQHHSNILPQCLALTSHIPDLPHTASFKHFATMPRPDQPHTRPAPHSIIQTFCHNASPWPATYQTCPTQHHSNILPQCLALTSHIPDLPHTASFKHFATMPRPDQPHTRPAPHSIIQPSLHSASPCLATYQTCPTQHHSTISLQCITLSSHIPDLPHTASFNHLSTVPHLV